MKVGFIGLGKLGFPVCEVMAQSHEVYGYDIAPRKETNFKIVPTLRDAVEGRDIVFVAVETPHDPAYGGEVPISHLPTKDFDYSLVKQVLKDIDQYATKDQLVVLISTVLPGTTRQHLKPQITNARFAYNPYLIAMSSVKEDFVCPEMVIIGTEDGSLTTDAGILIDFYNSMMKINTRYEVGTWDEAEAIKIFYNTFISAKLALVNMVQDVAEENGNMNVDVVTRAIAKSDMRIMGPAYMKAGMGDGGPCHPRDNIALKWLAEKLDLGYDLFGSIMHSREQQAKRLAQRLMKEDSNVVIIGKAYKPDIHLTSGSYSLLVGHYVEELGGQVHYYDPNTGDTDLPDFDTCVYLIGYWEKWVKEFQFKPNAKVVDPWRQYAGENSIHYGNTRPGIEPQLERVSHFHKYEQQPSV